MLGILSQGPIFASDVIVNITVTIGQGHEFLMNSETAELATVLFLAFSPLCTGCASGSTGTKGSGNIAGFKKSFLSALLTMACHRGLSFLLFPPYLLLKTGLCFICSVLPSLLHLSNAHLANS